MPGLLDRAAKWLRRQLDPSLGPALDPRAWWQAWHWGGGHAWGPRITNLPRDPRGALALPVFSSCVSLISQSLATEDGEVVRQLEGGGAEPVENEADALLDLMDFGAKERFVADSLISGNGFLHKADGGLTALPWENTHLQWSAGPGAPPPVYWYFDPMAGTSVAFAPSDLCHLRYRNYGRYPWLGVPPLLAVGDAIGLGIASRVLQGTSFTNAARPAGVLMTESKLDRQKAAEIQARWNENYGGADAAGKTAVLEQGLKYQAIALANLVELQMAELQKSNDQDICRAFNVPPQVVGEVTQNRANSEEATRLLTMTCLRPMARRVTDALGLYLLSDAERAQGIRVSISLRSLTRGHGLELAQSLNALVLGGVITRNEARSDLGLIADPAAQDFWQPVNVETTTQASQRSAANTASALGPQAPDLQAEGNVVSFVPRSFREALQ
jgi:HK97 family phage portal protein